MSVIHVMSCHPWYVMAFSDCCLAGCAPCAVYESEHESAESQLPLGTHFFRYVILIGCQFKEYFIGQSRTRKLAIISTD